MDARNGSASLPKKICIRLEEEAHKSGRSIAAFIVDCVEKSYPVEALPRDQFLRSASFKITAFQEVIILVNKSIATAGKINPERAIIRILSQCKTSKK